MTRSFFKPKPVKCVDIVLKEKKSQIVQSLLGESFHKNEVTQRYSIAAQDEQDCSEYGSSKQIKSKRYATNIAAIVEELLPKHELETRGERLSDLNEKLDIPVFFVNEEMCESQTYPLQTNIPCFFCRRTFDTCPIGMPLKYNPPHNEIKNFSKQTGYEFKIRNTYSIYSQNNSKQKDEMSNMTALTFDCDGVFCSFNCLKAELFDNASFTTRHSQALIYKMMKHIFPEADAEKITRTPSWKSRTAYGGRMTDFEYCENMCTVNITVLSPEDKKTLLDRLKSMKPLSRLFQLTT